MAKQPAYNGLHHQWHRTPWLAFWRPAWRRMSGHAPHTNAWEYQTHKQRARDVLEKSYDPAWAYSRGGEDAAQGCPTSPQQANNSGYPGTSN